MRTAWKPKRSNVSMSGRNKYSSLIIAKTKFGDDSFESNHRTCA